MVSIRAIYRNGQLQLLDSVDLEDGQEVELHIIQPQEPLKTLISDMLITFDADEAPVDEEALRDEIDKHLKGKRPLSEIILENR